MFGGYASYILFQHRLQLAAPALVPASGWLACVLLCLPAAAQTTSAPTFHTRSDLVLVRVVVRDREGRAIGNLHKEDFQLSDKGKPQIISRFSAERTASQ